VSLPDGTHFTVSEFACHDGMLARFWSKVASVGNVCECWNWTASTDGGGYGQVKVGGRKGRLLRAHRVAYEITRGAIPAGLELDHLCSNRKCVNPWHLEPVTRLENARRGDGGWNTRGRTHCPRGHEYDKANTYVYRGRRGGRACNLLHTHARRWKLAS
jgi:hypothetical protein